MAVVHSPHSVCGELAADVPTNYCINYPKLTVLNHYVYPFGSCPLTPFVSFSF